MTEQTGNSAGTATSRRASGPLDQEREKRVRRLLLLKAGPRLLCVFADQAGSIVAWREPTPLPRAPQAVLGVVSIRGCMFTVLDLFALAGEEDTAGESSAVAPPSYAFILPLLGDEQLALALEQSPRAIEIFTDEIEPSSNTDAGPVIVRRIIRDEHEGQLSLLNVQEMFAAAMQGAERRRRRF